MTDRLDDEMRLRQDGCFWKIWGDFWLNLPGLLGANLLFLLWCAPFALAAMLPLEDVAVVLALVTVGPALLGLFTYTANLVVERPAGFWRDGLRGLRTGFGAGVLITAVALLALRAHGLILAKAPSTSQPMWGLALWGAQMAILAVLAVAGAHTLSLISLYQQGVREAFRNAILLTLGHPGPTLGLVAAAALAFLVARTLRWGPLVILPALLSVLAVNTTLRLVRQHCEGHVLDSSHL